jgi:ElaB/YqjD/DUF883 family membrane-anchored ribosome-binding protein
MMAAVKTKNRHKNNILYDDVEKIKAAIANATFDVKDKMGEMFSDSLNNVKDQSFLLRDNLSTYTAKKPFKSLSIAVLTGMLIGFFMHK